MLEFDTDTPRFATSRLSPSWSHVKVEAGFVDGHDSLGIDDVHIAVAEREATFQQAFTVKNAPCFLEPKVTALHPESNAASAQCQPVGSQHTSDVRHRDKPCCRRHNLLDACDNRCCHLANSLTPLDQNIISNAFHPPLHRRFRDARQRCSGRNEAPGRLARSRVWRRGSTFFGARSYAT
jgi:hypothetical protein